MSLDRSEKVGPLIPFVTSVQLSCLGTILHYYYRKVKTPVGRFLGIGGRMVRFLKSV